METTDIKNKLHHYVDKGDSKLLNLMYVLAKEYNNEDDFEYEFSEEEIKFFEQRKAKRESGESTTFTWDKAKELITSKRK